MKHLVALLVYGSLFAAAVYPQPIVVSIDTERSVLHYTGYHPVHAWRGTSRAVQGRLLINFEHPAQSQVEIIVPVASFDSGNGMRDANMRERVDAEQYPEVRFVSEAIEVVHRSAPADEPGSYRGTWHVHGALSFHGQTHPVIIPVDIQVEGNTFTADAAFQVSLKRFGVRRPWLLMVPIKEHIDVQGMLHATLPEAVARR